MVKVDTLTLIRKAVYIYIYIKRLRKVFGTKQKQMLVGEIDRASCQTSRNITGNHFVFIKPHRLHFENTNISGHCACIILSKFGLYKDKGLHAECW